MLVLSRRVNEQIVFPNLSTIVRVVAMKAGTVRLGIQAPENVEVFREEVLDPKVCEEIARGRSAPVATPALRHLLHQLNNRLNAGGIGLALLRRQLELGRTAEIANTLDRLEQELAALRQAVAAAEPDAPPDRDELSRRRALLVEDDVNECELLAGFLRLAGLDVTTAHDGGDALDHLRRDGRPDVVLLDMILPRTDGPATVRAIRDNPANAGLKIFGMTGADPRRFNLPEGDGGVDYWFHKPLNPQSLLAEMARVMR
jgi:carbon storage regulator CsrA